MESRFNTLKNLIESKKEKYPNISNIWLKYLDQKFTFLNESLEKAEVIFNNIDNNQDIPINTIAILYLINQEPLP